MSERPLKPCAYCRSRIEPDASVCPHCQKGQNRPLNLVTWLAGVVGLFTFLGSGFVYLDATYASWRVRNFGADLQLRNFSNVKGMTLLNNSSEAVVIGTVFLDPPGSWLLQVIVDRSVEPGEIVHVDLNALFLDQTTGPATHRFGAFAYGGHLDARGLSASERAAILADLDATDYERFTVEMLNRDGADFRFFAGDQPGRVDAPCAIRIDYQVVRGGAFPLEPECVGVVHIRE